MAFIDFCKRDAQSAAIQAVCLSKDECMLLLPRIRKEVKKARERVEHYEDKIIDGYGTEHQSNKLVQWQDTLDILENIEKTINSILD